MTEAAPPDVDHLLGSLVLGSLSPTPSTLAEAPEPSADLVRPSPVLAPALVDVAAMHRVTGLVWASVIGGRLELPDADRNRLERRHRHALTVCLRLEEHLVEMGDALDARGVEFRVLKGSAVAHLDYDQPELRIFGDVDLLVRPEQFDDAVAAITSTGVQRRFPEIRPRFDQRFAKGVEFYSDAVPAVDLHRTFVMGPFGLRLSIDDLWAASDTFDLAGVTFRALDRDLRFLHACYHAALGDASPRWAQLADIVQMLRRPGDAVDVGRCRELAASWGGDSVVARAVRLAWDRFGLEDDELSTWASSYQPDATERRGLRTYLDPSMGYAARCAASIGSIPSWRDRASFTWSLAVPAAEYGAGQHGGHLRRWRNAIVQLVRLASPGRRGRDLQPAPVDSPRSDEPMRVLLVVKGLDLGGVERIVVDLALGLRGRGGVDVEVAVVNDRRDQMVGLLEDAGVIVHRLGGSDRVGAGAAILLGRLLRRGRFAVVHVHGPLPAVVVRCVPGRTAIVTTSHTLWSGLRAGTRIAWRLTSRRDRATLAVSSAVAQSLPRRVAARTTVLPHGIDVAAVSAVIAERTGASDCPDDVTAICVASHRDVKNYPNLLRAFAAAGRTVPELRLVAVGDGPDRETHRRLAADLGIADRVRFEPATLDVMSMIAASDLLVVASDFEGQPLVVLEAMALGVAVVATAVGRVPEVVGPEAGRIVAPGDSAALAAAIAEVASDRELRRSLGRSGRSVSGTWTLDHVVDAHLAVYRSVTRLAG